jgi:F0F1-type ATP synthase beta subunit
MATPGIVGARHYALAQEIRRTLAQYAELKDIIAMLGLQQLSPQDRNVVARGRRLERFLAQPFFTTIDIARQALARFQPKAGSLSQPGAGTSPGEAS